MWVYKGVFFIGGLVLVEVIKKGKKSEKVKRSLGEILIFCCRELQKAPKIEKVKVGSRSILKSHDYLQKVSLIFSFERECPRNLEIALTLKKYHQHHQKVRRDQKAKIPLSLTKTPKIAQDRD